MMNLADHSCPRMDGFSHPHHKRYQVTTELMLSYLVPVFHAVSISGAVSRRIMQVLASFRGGRISRPSHHSQFSPDDRRSEMQLHFTEQ